MLVPLHDENSLKHIPFQFVTALLLATNVLVYLLFQSELVFQPGRAVTAALAIIPMELFGDVHTGTIIVGRNAITVPEFATPVTYMFLHGSWMHLLGNLLFLYVFGDNVEDAMGHFRFFIFYILCGVFAGMAHSYIVPTSASPLIGASGAVAGVIAAYLMLHPNVAVWVLAFQAIPLKLKAMWVLGFWVAWQFISVMLPQTGGNTAWWAHIGGLAAGAALIIILRRPGVPLFNNRPAPAGSAAP